MPGAQGISRWLTFRTRTGRHDLEAKLLRLGERDYVLCIWGGDRPHIGAVGMALARPSLRDPDVQSSTSSVFTYPGHKEDLLVKDVSERLAAALGGHVVVCAGAHWENLDAQGIQEVLDNCRRLVSLILKRLGSSPGSRVSP
ncbi:MAG: prenylated flavin chaperone LpdD [Thermodesulfobacteriota bacterium]